MPRIRSSNAIFSAAIGLALWLYAGQAAIATHPAPTGCSSLAAWAAPANRLEERLFADAADGRLEQLAPFEAALVASGAHDDENLACYRTKAHALAEQLRRSIKLDVEPRQSVQAIFEFLHAQALRGGYDLAYTDLRRVLDDGRYNCVSATVLFNYLAGAVGLDCRGLEMPGHAMSRVRLLGSVIDVETTCPEWFRLKKDAQPPQRPAATAAIGAAAAADRSKAREVSPIQLAAMIYYNRGVDLLAEKQFRAAAEANAKALRLDSQNALARRNLLATINNWAIDMGDAQQFAEAVALLRQGMALDTTFEAFGQNFAHIHRQWAERLCREGRFAEAGRILAQALLEMPNCDALCRVQAEVVRRRAAQAAAGD